MDEHSTQPVFYGQSLEQLLALRRLDIEMPGDEVGERTRIAHTLKDLLHHLRRQAGLLAQFSRTLADFAMQGDERGVRLVEGWKV